MRSLAPQVGKPYKRSVAPEEALAARKQAQFRKITTFGGRTGKTAVAEVS